MIRTLWLLDCFQFLASVGAKLQISSTTGAGAARCVLLERDVGLKCLAAVVGIGQSRLRRAMAGAPDLRFGKKALNKSQPGTYTVDAFLQVCYDSIGETLPDRLLALVADSTVVCIEVRSARQGVCPEARPGRRCGL